MDEDNFWRPSIADLITVGAVVVAAVMWLKQPSWQWELPITAVVIGLVIFTAARHRSHPIRRVLVALSVIWILVWAAWEPFWNSFHADYPNTWLPWGVSFVEQQNNFPPDFPRSGCGGVLHRTDGDLRFGGNEGEGESICIINKAEEARVLAVCAVDHLCRVTGDVAPCDGSGECAKLSRIKSVVVPPMPVLPSDAPEWIKIAYKERGQTEIPGPQENPRIVEYFATIGEKANYRDDVDDWASAFVEWSFNKAGIDGPKNDDPFAWLRWGEKVDHPRFGCVAVLSFSGLRHVGFFFSDNGESILVLGGNQDDTVNVSRYSKSDVVGYRCPTGQK
jgi:uncharacterized protein (TIGR02594 family)